MYKLNKNKFIAKKDGFNLFLSITNREQNKIIDIINKNDSLKTKIIKNDDEYESELKDVIVKENDSYLNKLNDKYKNSVGYLKLKEENDKLIFDSIFLQEYNKNLKLIKNYENIEAEIEFSDDFENKNGFIYIPILKNDLYETFKENHLKKIYESLNFGLSATIVLLVLILIFK